MSNRTINTELLRKWIAKHDPIGRARLSIDARVSTSLIDKLLAGTYGCIPKDYIRERICVATGLKESDLFPLVTSKGRKAAS